MAITTTALACLLILTTSSPLAVSAHNITEILNKHPNYSQYNSYLSQTKVSDDINTRQTITCLVLNNTVMSSLTSHPLSVIKNILRLLTLLDYFDPKKLHSLPSGSTVTTTLLQTTGTQSGNTGFVNITNLRGGKVGFSSASPGSKFDSFFISSVELDPYNLSVLAITSPIIFPGLLDPPAPSNLTAVLEKAGCKTFASLLVSSGMIKPFEDAMDNGITIFAPNDEAFKKPGVPDLASVSSAELVTILQYHAMPDYRPKATLKATAGKMTTFASTVAEKFVVSVVSTGDDVSLVTGVDTSRVASTVIDNAPACVMTVDSVLLPVELFGKGPSPAPAHGAPGLAPSPAGLAPSPAVVAPSPAGLAPSPAHGHKSPPAPPADSPDLSPGEAPEPSADDRTPDDKGFAVTLTRPLGFLACVFLVLL